MMKQEHRFLGNAVNQVLRIFVSHCHTVRPHGYVSHTLDLSRYFMPSLERTTETNKRFTNQLVSIETRVCAAFLALSVRDDNECVLHVDG